MASRLDQLSAVSSSTSSRHVCALSDGRSGGSSDRVLRGPGVHRHALAGALGLPHARGSWVTLLWLAGLCAVLVRIEFEVGEGRTRPVQLVFVPMLLLLPAGGDPARVVLRPLPGPSPRFCGAVAGAAAVLISRGLLVRARARARDRSPRLPDGRGAAAALCLIGARRT